MHPTHRLHEFLELLGSEMRERLVVQIAYLFFTHLFWHDNNAAVTLHS